jgi:alpha-glucosidase
MSAPPWWQTGVIYQIYPRSFADSNGDGIGDLRGINLRLDYLSDVLGVDAIWLSPFYPSPQEDFGYDVADYVDVDPIYGTLRDFDQLVEQAHRRGLKVIVDYVINHTSDRHSWFLESSRAKDSRRRDWYVWRDQPNNWVSVFGGSAWEPHPSGQFYLHSFLASQPDLNWRNPEVEAAMLDVLRFWMERGVDGFRIDVAHFAMKDPLLRDNPMTAELPADSYKLNTEYAAMEHIYDRAHPEIHALFRRLRDTLDQYPDRFSVGEIHEYDWQRWAAFYGQGDELHMPFNFALLPAGIDPVRIRAAIIGMESVLPAGGWPNWVAGNHDEPRIASRLGKPQSWAMAMILLSLRGTPTLYYGDEIGMEELEILPERQQDPWGRRKPGFGRDGCRTPMQWSPGPKAGFTSGSQSWLPVHPDHAACNVELQRGDAHSLLELYRRLLRVRKASLALTMGSVEVLDSPSEVLSFRRNLAGSPSFETVANLSANATVIKPGGRIAVATNSEREGQQFDGSLDAWEAVLVEA